MTPDEASQKEKIIIRPGTIKDAPAMIELMDKATKWLVDNGCSGQWGDKRPSDNPERIKQLTDFAASGGTWIAVDSTARSEALSDRPDLAVTESAASNSTIGGVVGAITLGEANSYVKPATEPELYVQFLISDRSSHVKGVGSMLLEHARKLAREAGITLLRVDCYAGSEGKLVKYYESQGFEKSDTFEVKGWKGQVLTQRLS